MGGGNWGQFLVSKLSELRGVDPHVYEPAEDSYLLLRVAHETVTEDQLVVDVGTGSGFLAERLREQLGVRVVGVDVNPHACRRAVEAGVPTIRGHVVTAIRDSTVDVVVCNPPYLPTAEARTGNAWFDRALDGGTAGRAIVTALVAELPRVLGPGGCALLLVSSAMGIEAVTAHAEQAGFDVRVVAEDRYPDERLAVLQLASSPTPRSA